MKLEERLIVAADFDPRMYGGARGVRKKVLELARELEGSSVCIKINSVLRACGYDLIDEIHMHGLAVFADLKLNDIPNTMATDAAFLTEYEPEFLTVMCSAGIDGMSVVREAIPETGVLGVTVFTSLDDSQCRSIFGCRSADGVLRFSRMAKDARLTELILSPKEVELVRSDFRSYFTLNTPGIRPRWSIVYDDDQSRVTTPAQAIRSGADRIVVGRPIIQARSNCKGNPASPREAVEWTLKEMQQGLDERFPVL